MAKSRTLKDVAREAGVSASTVSRVISGLPVKKSTRQRVEAIIASTGYSPNLAARSLKTRSTQTIVCAIRGLLSPAMSPFLRGVEQTVRAAGYRLVLMGIEEDAASQREALMRLSGDGLDGLIFAGAPDHTQEINEVITKLSLPAIVVDREPTHSVDTINVGHEQGMRMAVEHLHALGHEHIALITGSSLIRPGQARIRGFLDAAQACFGGDSRVLVLDDCNEPEAAFVVVSGLLASPKRPSALIAGGMTLLPGVLQAIRAQGLRVGKDVSVIAGCDTDLAALFDPAITAIRWDLTQWGALSAQMLLKRIQNPDMKDAQHVLLPVDLVCRQSCASLRTV